jgi:hypothetical protein
MRKLLNGLNAFRTPDKKTSDSRTGSAHHPDNTFHVLFSPSLAVYGGHGSLDADGTRNVLLSFKVVARYTIGMDRVRFGRALGVGARQAAKTLLSAAEAAAAPDPRRQGSPGQRAATPSPTAASRFSSEATERNTTAAPPRVKVDPRVVAGQTRTLGSSVWSPFAKFSSVLWLEVTGTFFAIFALIAGLQIWKFHAALLRSPAAPDARRLYVYIAVFAVFGYFTVSSFVRAGRRQRR